ncbi:MAG TPA: hypothetical protein VEH81_12475 [Ktedonobacteraceae bacterium]|nr:hypothetical protein [Ktedonobacteraceae bacterium]
MYWEVDYFRRPYRLYLLLLAFSKEQELHKSIQCGFQVAYSLFGLAMFHRFRHAVLDVMFKNGLAHLVETGTYRSDLGQHVVAFTPLVPKPLETVGMTSDASEPFGDLFA